MPNRLADAVSPYLRSHAENPVDWHEWGPEAFAEAAARDVPVFISIGYATCHWCHVMARESFSDPAIAEVLNEGFVAIKVDREEYPDVDSSYLTAASAFTKQLGWPLSIFATSSGATFHAGTYFPPQPLGEVPSFRQVLGAVREAWTSQRADVESSAEAVITALNSFGPRSRGELPTASQLAGVAAHLEQFEDPEFGGLGSAPKFPVAPVMGFLLDVGSPLAARTLDRMAASPLCDAVEGGFFRYATRPDWTEPHYERMLYDNALLLGAYARAGRAATAEGIANFLLTVLRVPGSGFASAQDSESVVDGARTEGGYYGLSAARRAEQVPPALDEKVLTGWNGLAIGNLALAGRLLERPEWITAAIEIADILLERGMVRAAVGEAVSSAPVTLEDYGMLAWGLTELALATGEVRWAVEARRLAAESESVVVDETLAANGIAFDADPTEGAYPSGHSTLAAARYALYLLTADAAQLEAARGLVEPLAPLAAAQPLGFGAALGVMVSLAAGVTQLVVVDDAGDSELAAFARRWDSPGAASVVVTSEQATAFAAAGFELFEGRAAMDGAATAYLCRDFVCALPTGDVAAVSAELT